MIIRIKKKKIFFLHDAFVSFLPHEMRNGFRYVYQF